MPLRAASRPAAPLPPPVPSALQRPPGLLRLRVLTQDITEVKAPVAVVGRYLNTQAGGAMSGFNQKLKNWLQIAIDRGVIGSLLGELAFVPIPDGIAVDSKLLVVGGMGEYGRFTRDDLSYLATNVALAVHFLGYGEFATVPIGSGNQGMPPARSARAIAEGVLAAFDHLAAGTDRKGPELGITFCVREPDAARELFDELSQFREELTVLADNGVRRDRVELEALKLPSGRAAADSGRSSRGRGTAQNRVTIARIPTIPGERPPTAPAMATLEYAALTSSAVMPVRRQQVQEYYLRHIPEGVKAGADLQQQERLGELLSRYLVPADLQALIYGGDSLTLILDPEMAAIPWEMACYQRLGASRFYGTQLNLSRQFRTAQTAAPGLAPPVNEWLNVLVIADPAGGAYALPGARAEANAVLRALGEAREAWQGELKIRATVCVGPPGAPQNVLNSVLDGVPEGLAGPPRPCEPLEVLALMLNDGFDVIHYAGHGEFDRAAGRMGWVFADNFLLTATDALKAARVPRLVFANACHSAELAADPRPTPGALEMVSLAEAFFQQGIENYIGTGWEVDDAAARDFATEFYRAALGRDDDDQPLARAAALAREAILTAAGNPPPPGSKNSTWGAYQYYGQPGTRLIKVRGKD